MRPKLGQQIRARRRLVRREKWRSKGGVTAKFWAITLAPIEGIYVGTRTLSNGTRQLQNYDEGYVYTASDYFEAWMIVEHERRKPVFVLPDDCEIIE